MRELFINFCILTTLTMISCIIIGVKAELPTTWPGRLRHWAAFWVAAFILMQFPLVCGPGGMMAFYAVPSALAGLFGGVSWGLIAALPVALYRLWLGGAGAAPGVVHVLAVGLLAGLLCRRAGVLRAPVLQLAWRCLLTFAVGNLSMLLVPGLGFSVFRTYYPVMMPLSALALLLCVYLVKMRVDSQRELATATTMAHLDALTGLPNQRSLMEAIAARPPGRHDCFLLLDIDHFKDVNDTYGHQSGDAVLRQLGDLLRQEVRASDLVCRYGGEEFAVLMRGCTLSRARDVAERLREAVASSVMAVGEHRVKLTISGGLVALGPEAPFAAQFRVADSLLYEAKRRGRNGVVYEDLPPSRSAASGLSADE